MEECEIMVSKRFECATCDEVFPSKNQIKKHQRRQKPKHSGIIPIIDIDVGIKTNKQSTSSTKSKVSKSTKIKGAGDRATGSGGSRNSTKESGPLEPVFESGFIRISTEKFNEIKEKLPNGSSHHIVEGTNHHIIEFTGEAYETIDYLMYLHNFVELEMFYQDLAFCLNIIPSKEKIRVIDMCELGVSNILYIEDGIIRTEFGEQSTIETIINEELLTSIGELSGIAIAEGKFIKDNSPKSRTSNNNIPKNPITSTPTTDIEPVALEESWNLMENSKVDRSTSDRVSGQWYQNDFGEWVMEGDEDLCRECSGKMLTIGGDKRCEECGLTTQTETEIDIHQDTLWGWDSVDSYDGDNMQFGAQEIGYNKGLYGRGYSYGGVNTYKPSPPVARKYHPIYGIRGNNIVVDRIVDLTELITQDIVEVEETKEAETYISPTDRPLRIRQGIAKNWRNHPNSPNQLNVAITPVDMAIEWSEKRFAEKGLTMSDYIPHFRENYLSLQEECRLAIDIPRIDMPVIDPEELEGFTEKLRSGALDVFEPFAIGDSIYSPENLISDSPEAIQFLLLGYKDGKLEDDVVSAKIMMTLVGLMRPTQSQIWLNKLIDSIIEYGKPQKKGKLNLGAYNDKSIILKKTIAISQEGYILDGHHRYGQIALVNPSLKMMCLYIGLPIRRLIEIARPYGNAIGNEQRAAEDSTTTN